MTKFGYMFGSAAHDAYLKTKRPESIYEKAMREVGKIICEKCDIDFTDYCDDTGYFEEIGNRIICCECEEKEEEEEEKLKKIENINKVD